ncbi:ABC transporter permease [Actinomyces glycerinitolerans]|uniref:Abc transporter permease n=2 Tax=Actinomyces TaxID=1654 RepID=A0A1M4RY33_9ACTO|nr:ABC transporter permease [Actinomyces glycerinitolerans]SHE24839.1 abc transporter permease [Actinomyces glycerinitolerans]
MSRTSSRLRWASMTLPPDVTDRMDDGTRTDMNNIRSRATAWRSRINAQTFTIAIAALVIYLGFGILNPRFLGLDNLRDVAISACVNGLIGLGMTFVIITGGIDLSVGSIASLSGMVSAALMVNQGLNPYLGFVVGLVVGALCGLVNGVLVALVRLPPFIATLGTMSIFQGLAYVVTDGLPVYNIPKPFVMILNSRVMGIPTSVAAVAICAILCWFLLRRTVFGQNVIATGGSEETAWLSGVNVARVKIWVYVLAGTLSGLGGMVVVARISAAQSEAGAPYQMTAIASSVIGGANLMGGEGSIGGTIIGALILGALTNGLVLLSVPSFYEQIVTGLVVVIAVTFDQVGKNWPAMRRGTKRPKRSSPVPSEPQESEMHGSQTATTSGAGHD